MKKILLITLAMLTLGLSNAQNVLNNAADNIVGTYSGTQDDEQFRAKSPNSPTAPTKGR